MSTISLIDKDDDDINLPQINIALLRLLMVLSKAGQDRLSTEKLLDAVHSSHHGQRMIKLGVKKGYIERFTVPQPKGKRGNAYTMNRLTPRGKRFLSKLLTPSETTAIIAAASQPGDLCVF
jgi:hypothetical protein